MPREPFDMMRGVFLLAAVIIVGAVAMSLLTTGACVTAALLSLETTKYCQNLGLKDFMTELLATLLVLISARNTKPPE